MKLFILFFLFANLIAQDDYSFRVGYGQATQSDFSQAIHGDWESSSVSSEVVSLDVGYLLIEDYNDWPMDVYVKGGLSRIDSESGTQDLGARGIAIYDSQTVYATRVYIKAFWNFDFWDNRVRFGFGEGVSYTSDTLNVEQYEADSENDNSSNFLNYIDFSLDFSIGKLVNYKPFDEVYLGWALEHRSGIFGLINNVEKGGSNYNTFYVESKF